MVGVQILLVNSRTKSLVCNISNSCKTYCNWGAWDPWSNTPQLTSFNYFVGTWPLFIISLPYDHPHPSRCRQFAYKLVAKQWPTKLYCCDDVCTCMYMYVYYYYTYRLQDLGRNLHHNWRSYVHFTFEYINMLLQACDLLSISTAGFTRTNVHTRYLATDYVSCSSSCSRV